MQGLFKKKVANSILKFMTIKNRVSLLLHLKGNDSLYLRSQSWQNQYLNNRRWSFAFQNSSILLFPQLDQNMLIHRFVCVFVSFLNLFIEQNNGPPARLAFAQVSVHVNW